MQATPENIHGLRDVISRSMAPDSAIIKEAEAQIKQIEGQQGFTLVLLHLIKGLCPSTVREDIAVRQASSVLFKNAVKKRWDPNEDEFGPPIPECDRTPIRENIVDLMCSAPNDVQRQIAESMSIISTHDFPHNWGDLLPQLTSRLAQDDIHVTKGVMLTANSVMKRFRYVIKTDEVLTVLKFCLQHFEKPLLEVLKHTSGKVLALTAAGPEGKEQLEVVLETTRLMCRIFFSLNWQDIPEFFEDEIATVMTEFANYLQYQNPLLVDEKETQTSGPIEKLQANIIENLNLYATKYEEEFAPYLPNMTKIVWELLVSVPGQAKYDPLATNAIQFLVSVCSKDMNKGLFTEDVVKQIVEQIVVKNLKATDLDEELFEENPSDYIRKDVEGSDQNTRRRCAMELVRSLLKLFSEPVTRYCLEYVQLLLEEYEASSRTAWQKKDAALHLVLAVSVTAATAAAGASSINPGVPVMQIFGAHVMPEINDSDVNARPVLRADAIKMILTFRQHFGVDFMLELVPILINHLSSEHVVVQTYAAMCLERFLTVKDQVSTGGQVVRLNKSSLTPHLNALFTGLFSVLENDELPENDYVMKCIMRVLLLIGADVAPIATLVLSKLTSALTTVCANPSNPQFNHYLFECLAVLVRSLCTVPEQSGDELKQVCNQFETLLFPPFTMVLQNEVAEFVPYVFQVMAEMLFYQPTGAGLSTSYAGLFTPLLSPTLWESKGNVPALTELFKAYIAKGMPDLLSTGKLEPILGVFQKLLSLKSTEAYAFQMLNSLVAYNDWTIMSQYMPNILGLMLTRLMQYPDRFSLVRGFLHSIFYMALRYEGSVIGAALDSIQAGMLEMLITGVLCKDGEASIALRSICGMGKSDMQEVVAGATKILCDTPITRNPDTFASFLKAIVHIAICASKSRGSTTAATIALLESSLEDDDTSKEFDSTYSKLAYANVPSPQVAPQATACDAFLAQSLSRLSTSAPGQYAPLIQQALGKNEEYVQYLQQILHQNGVAL